MTNFNGISSRRFLSTANGISGSRDYFLRGLVGSSNYRNTANNIANTSSSGNIDFSANYDAESMSFEEFKSYVTGVIDGMSLHPTRQDDKLAVDLNDEVLQKMKADPEYSNWVLNSINDDFNTSAASSKDRQAYALSWITDALDEYQSERWLSPFDSDYGASKFSMKAKNSLWSNMDANLMMANLMMKAQQKQSQMAQQTALQMKAAQNTSKAQTTTYPRTIKR